jgi:hypothetical protein
MLADYAKALLLIRLTLRESREKFTSVMELSLTRELVLLTLLPWVDKLMLQTRAKLK